MKLSMIDIDQKPELVVQTENGWLKLTSYFAEVEQVAHFTMESLFDSKVYKGLQFLLESDLTEIDSRFWLDGLDNLSFYPPVRRPNKILAVGLNHRNHITETKMDKPKVPEIFAKLSNSLNSHKSPIIVPDKDLEYDCEGELVIVIGKETKHLSPEQASQAIFGYTIGNDFSSRKLQLQTSQWILGKSLDGSAPIGPNLVTRDQLDLSQTHLSTKINGRIVQEAMLTDMLFSPQEIVSYLSQYLTLEPGDLIFTGTPAGVIMGHNLNQLDWLKQDDSITITIDGIGTLENTLTYEK